MKIFRLEAGLELDVELDGGGFRVVGVVETFAENAS